MERFLRRASLLPSFVLPRNMIHRGRPLDAAIPAAQCAMAPERSATAQQFIATMRGHGLRSTRAAHAHTTNAQPHADAAVRLAHASPSRLDCTSPSEIESLGNIIAMVARWLCIPSRAPG